MSDLNNTPDVVEKPVADAPDALKTKHKRDHSVCEWWALRLSAAALVPLSIWAVTAVVEHLLGASTAEITAWITHLPVAIAMALFIIAGFMHTRLGIHEIVTDYVHCPCKRKAVNGLVDILSLALAGGSLWAIFILHKAA
jgi:succinate dehydrogenase / fumarate reductase membrane anchor subunit